MQQHFKGKKSFVEVIKQLLWFFIYPIFTGVRDTLLKLRIIRHYGRQPYHLGYLAPNITIEHFKKHLREQGFHRCIVAWHDDEEILGMRKHNGFRYQYHIRLFEDREIRAHYEFTVESHPFKHLFEKEMVPAKERFENYLGPLLVKPDSGKTTSHK